MAFSWSSRAGAFPCFTAASRISAPAFEPASAVAMATAERYGDVLEHVAGVARASRSVDAGEGDGDAARAAPAGVSGSVEQLARALAYPGAGAIRTTSVHRRPTRSSSGRRVADDPRASSAAVDSGSRTELELRRSTAGGRRRSFDAARCPRRRPFAGRRPGPARHVERGSRQRQISLGSRRAVSCLPAACTPRTQCVPGRRRRRPPVRRAC